MATWLKKMLAGAVLAAAPITAQAGQITVTFDQGASRYANAQVSYNSGGSWATVGAGMLAFDVTASDISGLTNSIIYSWCIEPTENVANGTYTVGDLQYGDTAIGGMGTVKAQLINELFARFDTVLPTYSTTQKAQALQLVIWEILTETSGTYDVSTGTSRFIGCDSTVVPLAQSYINAITPAGGPLLSNLLAFYKIGGQDQVFQLQSGQGSAPEPGALGLLGLGLVGAGLARRRRA